MRAEQRKVFDYLQDLASRSFIQSADGFKPLSEVVSVKLPNEILDLDDLRKSAAEMRLQKIAVAAAAAKNEKKSRSAPDRVQAKLNRLSELLADQDVWDVMATQLGVNSASKLIGKTLSAIEHHPYGIRHLSEDEWATLHEMSAEEAEAFIAGVRRHNVGESRRPRKLNAVDVGYAVAEVLRDCGLPVTTSETCLLARTLEAIRLATGFPTNSAKTPAKLKI